MTVSMHTRVFLVGLSGSGKSTVGQRVAKSLSWNFVDTDRQIVARSGMTIANMFKTLGEKHFRKLERNILLETLEVERTIVATGGGMMVYSDNEKEMLENGLVVYLKATPHKCANNLLRSQHHEKRPLIGQDRNTESALNLLLNKRKASYERAHFILDVEHLNLSGMTTALTNLIESDSG
tara:strand:+ start:3341 stop:3880 length:540 start_codon:yes stop_codon:yes gene_type:complete